MKYCLVLSPRNVVLFIVGVQISIYRADTTAGSNNIRRVFVYLYGLLQYILYSATSSRQELEIERNKLKIN